MNHVLIIPSEKFALKDNPMSGIFQLDQALILKKTGFKVGVVSISLKYSLPMILRGFLFKIFGRKTGNITDEKSFFELGVVLFDKLTGNKKFITKDEKSGLTVYRSEGFYLYPPSSSSDYKWWIKSGRKAVKNYIEDHGKPDFFYAHNALYAGILAMEMKKKYNIPYILTEHSSFFSRDLYHKSLLPIAFDAFKNADKFFVVSQFLGKNLSEIFDRIEYDILYNVVNPSFELTPLSQGVLNDDFTFVSVGSLIKIKNHALLIKAFHLAFPNKTNISLSIIGEGDERKALEDLIYDLKENDRIKLKGVCTREEILSCLDRKPVVLCLQSSYETFGVAILEALFRGVPVVATKCGGPQEIVNEDSGLLIKKENLDEMASALKHMYYNYGNYEPQKIREYAINKFGSKVFLEKIKEYSPSSDLFPD